MPTVGNRLIREAIDRVGVEQVARTLQLPPMSLDAYRTGARAVSDALLLKVIDLLDNLPKQ
jgi:hypothetical protein